MTPRTLSSKISQLTSKAPITAQFERNLRKLHIWGEAPVWYSTQKEHWLGWLKGYKGPGFYERKNWNRDAEFVYNHIVCPPMVLWLGEASGISSGLVLKAKQAALHAKPNLSAQAAAIRKVIPWGKIEDALGNLNKKVSLKRRTKRGNPKSQLAKAADVTEPHSLSEYCVYAIVERKKLDQDFKRQVSRSYKERKPWASATSLLEKSRLNECNMPVLFGNADDCSQLSHWGLLTDVRVNDDKTTEYTVDRLRKIGGKQAPQDLVLRSSGKNIAPHFIKSYAICKTPAFLLKGNSKQKTASLDKSDAKDEGPTDASQSRYTRSFQKWLREFTAAAAADNYANLLRPIEHLELKCSPKNAMAATIALVNAIVAYCQLDGRDCEAFLNRQQYGLNPDVGNKYCLTFDLSGMTSKYFGCILTDINFTSIDLEDLFDHPWPMSNTAGFSDIYITRLDGKRIGTREIKRLYQVVASDMYYGHSEEELSVDVIPSDFEDTVVIYAVETDGEDLGLG
jgi:hypothetical protein